MSSTNKKKAYVYKMKIGPANIFSIFIFFVMVFITLVLGHEVYPYEANVFFLFLLLIGYLFLHELLHGVGYILGGCDRKNIKYGLALEKGILYCMAYQEVSKKNILLSLQMPFTLIGVITYIIGLIINSKILVFLSILNIMGAAMDIVMFLYILKLDKDVIYSEVDAPDKFVLISKEDLSKKKSLFFEVVEVKDYNKKDYLNKIDKRFDCTKKSFIILLIFVVVGFLESLIIN